MEGKAIEIRGKTLGGDTPLICTPLVGKTRERVLAEAASVMAKSPDVIEWRVDYFAAIGDTAAVLETGRANERMPQKATYFLPKVTTGWVYHVHEDPAPA